MSNLEKIRLNPLSLLKGLSTSLQLNIRANTNPQVVGSVYIALTGPLNRTRTENAAPYALLGDNGGNYAGTSFPAGNYNLNAIAYSGANRGGSLLGSLQVQFTIGNQISAKEISDPGSRYEIQGLQGVSPAPGTYMVPGIQLYPNPAQSQIRISHSDPLVRFREIRIIDLSGRLVQIFNTLDGSRADGAYQIALRELEEGIYIVRVQTDTNQIYVLPLAIKH